jgi:hypothetical protein
VPSPGMSESSDGGGDVGNGRGGGGGIVIFDDTSEVDAATITARESADVGYYR